MAKTHNEQIVAGPETLEAALVQINTLNEALVNANAAIESLETELEDLKAAHSLDIETEHANLIAAHALEIESLEKLGDKAMKITKEVPGTYKSKEHGITIKFKAGCIKTRIENGVIVDSVDIIKNKGGQYTEFLDKLIDIRAGIIEEVK